MRRATCLMGVLVLAATLAGCAGSPSSPTDETSGGDPGDGGDDADAAQPPSPGGASPGAAEAPREGPTAILNASELAGVAPLTVSFTLNGSAPGGHEIAWRFDADGDGEPDATGTALPATYEHTYEAGNHVANLTVAAGNLSAHANVTILVTPSATPPAGEPVQVVEGELAAGVEGCVSWALYDTAGTDPAASYGGTLNGTTRIQFNVHPGTVGLTYRAVFTFDEGYLFVHVAFYDTAGNLLRSDGTTSPNFGGLTVTGTVPAGAARGVLFPCGGPTESHVRYEA